MAMMNELTQSKPKASKLNEGEYISSLAPIFIFASWAHNVTNDCSDMDYLGTVAVGTKNREQQRQQFHEMSAKVS